jgi:UDP-N-acetylmuramate dehydrogenase
MTLRENISLQPFNTFGIAAQARFLASVDSVENWQEILADHSLKQLPQLILGGGSNVLFTKDFEGIVLQIKIGGIEKIKEDEQNVWLKVGAGVNWHELVLYTIEQNWGGLENLSLIPGTTGAAPLQNIGAYGVEVRETIETVETLQLSDGSTRIFTHAACQFGYRESIFKHRLRGQYGITAVIFRLTKNPQTFRLDYGDLRKTLESLHIQTPTLRAVSEAVIHIRRSKLPDPEQIGNAGSFFKNPEVEMPFYEELKATFPEMPGYTVSATHTKIPAGWLIEQAGWKGRRSGEAGVHERQALVLVNYGNATGNQIRQLAQAIQADVLEKFGVSLTPEVNLV